MATLKARIKIRSATAAQWASANPVLLAGEIVLETDTKIIRVGDGATAFNMLPQIKSQALLDAIYQPKDATLTSLSALGTSANKIAYTTGVDTWAEAAITAAGRALIDDADDAAQRATLGLGSAALAALLDEDDFASDSATAVPSQQSTKAYVNAVIPQKLNASGSAPIYACRAWVNFNGTGTVAIRAAGNISSITDNGTGAYTIAFATAMPDVKYAVIGAATKENSGATTARIVTVLADTITVNGFSFRTETNNATNIDCEVVSLAIFR